MNLNEHFDILMTRLSYDNCLKRDTAGLPFDYMQNWCLKNKEQKVTKLINLIL